MNNYNNSNPLYLQDPSTNNVKEETYKLTPKFAFLTKGVGIHRNKLAAFEMALRKAGIANQNLVYVSSIFPPNCKVISKTEGIKFLRPGDIRFCVMSRNETNEPHRLISASIGLAKPKNKKLHGYISEHHNFGEIEKISGDTAEELAAEMLAETLNINFDHNITWHEKECVFKASGQIVYARNVTQTAVGHKDGLWTVVLSAAVFIL